jgi:hypothetical protein
VTKVLVSSVDVSYAAATLYASSDRTDRYVAVKLLSALGEEGDELREIMRTEQNEMSGNADFLDYDSSDWGYALDWLRDRGIDNVVPGMAHAEGGGLVLIRNQRGFKFTIEPGDRMRVIDGEVCLS